MKTLCLLFFGYLGFVAVCALVISPLLVLALQEFGGIDGDWGHELAQDLNICLINFALLAHVIFGRKEK